LLLVHHHNNTTSGGRNVPSELGGNCRLVVFLSGSAMNCLRQSSFKTYLKSHIVPSLVSIRSLSTPSASQRYTVTLFPGDGIGPEISKAVQDIFAAAQIPIDWEVYHVSTKSVKPGEELIPKEALDAVKRNGYGLKGMLWVSIDLAWYDHRRVFWVGPLETPIGKGHKSLNLTLRKALSLYANVRPCVSVPGVKTKYGEVDT